MIYTVGNEQMYLSALKQGELLKNARSEKFPTAKVFETVGDAETFMEWEMAVFGVEAEWDADTILDDNLTAPFRHLARDAKVVKLADYPYFTNRTPFKVGMPADHALNIIRRTFRRTKHAPAQIGEDSKGLIVKWFLTDCVLILRRMAVGGPYVVTGIKPKEG